MHKAIWKHEWVGILNEYTIKFDHKLQGTFIKINLETALINFGNTGNIRIHYNPIIYEQILALIKNPVFILILVFFQLLRNILLFST